MFVKYCALCYNCNCVAIVDVLEMFQLSKDPPSQVIRRVDGFNPANGPGLFEDVLNLRNEEGCLQASSCR